MSLISLGLLVSMDRHNGQMQAHGLGTEQGFWFGIFIVSRCQYVTDQLGVIG